ncbi:MAG: MerR family transcriptional regulator [Ardenticatenaceae bacterium]|nr:MerR family transcriptional regulator [Anaerolineales bacterium]MCB8941987.1 MerR family transcriptional regulator [Ardenticatenaceae bacterium]MCB8973100.1 MerR family transcriptional regulator [Ardenticatenaceae bacterium]
MSTNKHLPTFNMKVVVQETGLKPDTLRAWERRYGMPNPERTAGGHRLYSQHEIDVLNWLVARQGEGMSISHAVELWRQMEKDGGALLLPTNTPTAELSAPRVEGDQVDDLRKAWIEACLNFDEYQSQHLLAHAFAVFPLETVCFKILQQGLTEIGEGWYEGKVTVQQEHFASALAQRQLEALLAALPTGTRNGRILVACPPTEMHIFAPLMISLLLRRQGWDVVYLGANVPLDRMEVSVNQIKPLLVVLAAQTLTAAAHLLQMAQALQKMNLPLAFGGIVFNHIPQIIDVIPGYFLGSTLELAPLHIEKLMKNMPPTLQVKETPKAYHVAYQHFMMQRLTIEAQLHNLPELAAMPMAMLNNISNEFGNNVEAGLQFGDLDTVHFNLDWVAGLLENHAWLSGVSLREYLLAYYKVARSVLDARAAPLLHWLAQFKN